MGTLVWRRRERGNEGWSIHGSRLRVPAQISNSPYPVQWELSPRGLTLRQGEVKQQIRITLPFYTIKYARRPSRWWCRSGHGLSLSGHWPPGEINRRAGSRLWNSWRSRWSGGSFYRAHGGSSVLTTQSIGYLSPGSPGVRPAPAALYASPLPVRPAFGVEASPAPAL